MRAFVKYGNDPFAAEMRSVPLPDPDEMEVLIEVSGCGICGSDLHAYGAERGYEWVKPPVVLGHEFGGIVIATGSCVTGFAEGDKVVVIGIQGCMMCTACRSGDTNLCLKRKVIGLNMDGGMASHATVKAQHLIRVPKGVDFAQVAMIEPASVAMQALSKVRINPGDRVVVSGPGPIGLICCMLAKLYGAKVVLIGTDDDIKVRFVFAEKLGLATVNVANDPNLISIDSFFEGKSPDVWVEASGVPVAFISGAQRLRPGGALVTVGMYNQPVTWQPTIAVRHALSLYFSYSSVECDYQKVLHLMSDGLIDFSGLMNAYPLEEASQAFEAARSRKVIKPVLIP
ncbi:MAG: zinc-binding dehydrogenase [Desulfopila sp.]